MNHKARSNTLILADVKTAGMSFLAHNAELVIDNMDAMYDRDAKTQFIRAVFNLQNGFYDKDDYNTRNRVNAVIRILEAGKLIFALDAVVSSTDPRVTNETKECATALVCAIENGTVVLP